jgi:hypothetical protein
MPVRTAREFRKIALLHAGSSPIVIVHAFQAREFVRSLQLPPVSNSVRHIPCLDFRAACLGDRPIVQ